MAGKELFPGHRVTVVLKEAAPGSGRPESTKYIGCALQLLGSRWNRMVLAVLGSWIHAWPLIRQGASSDVLAPAPLVQLGVP
jgi:hypothetical protein